MQALLTMFTLEADRSVIEDMWWLHPVNNMQHINLAKLDTVLKGELPGAPVAGKDTTSHDKFNLH